jgi:hypothetical protein
MILPWFKTTSAPRGQKRHDRNGTVRKVVYLGRWTLILSTWYAGEMYGHLGSDSTEYKLVVTRNPK